MLLAVLEPLKVANAALWRARRARATARGSVCMPSADPSSFDLSYRMIAGHDRFHQAQAERAIDGVRGAEPGRRSGLVA